MANKSNLADKNKLASNSNASTKMTDDPFQLPHLGDYLGLQQLESTYRTKSGAPLPDGVSSPLRPDRGDMGRLFVHDEDRVLVKVVHYGHPTSVGIEHDENGEWQFKPMWARRAGPRAFIYFQPNKVKAAILTSGGLCPGLNDVIRQIVYTLEIYGVTEILGIQYGFRGFSDPKVRPIALNRKLVQRTNMQGGSFLGVSRGGPKVSELVNKLEEWNVNMLFVIGGNGSHAGAYAIFKEVWARKLKLAIVGVPKTIDNDFLLVDKSFGFDTAVEEAQRAINAAYVEASCAYNGVGIVKLMGRHSGFIAMHATLASGQVDMVFIPEVPFVMEGENGVLAYMKKKVEKNGICVVVIAEGAGQELLEKTGAVDASGNVVLADIGKWFYNQVKAYFSKIKMSADVKYIDPTYMIRARPCNSADHIFCSVLGQNAVHAAFAGYTNVTVGLVNTHYCLLPIPLVIKQTRTVDPNSNMWHRCVTSTGQPDFFSPGARPTKGGVAAQCTSAKLPTAKDILKTLPPNGKPKCAASVQPTTAAATAGHQSAAATTISCQKPAAGTTACHKTAATIATSCPKITSATSTSCHKSASPNTKPSSSPTTSQPQSPPSNHPPLYCVKTTSPQSPRSLLQSPICSPTYSPASSPTSSPISSPCYVGVKTTTSPINVKSSSSCHLHGKPDRGLNQDKTSVPRPPSPPCCHLHDPKSPTQVHHTLTCARPATAPTPASPSLSTQYKDLGRLRAQPLPGDVVVTVFLHYSKGKRSEAVGVVKTGAGVFEWPTIAVHRLIWEAGGDTLIQALTPAIASWYNSVTGGKAVQPMFLTYYGMIQGHRVAQFRLPACPYNTATWTGGLTLLHPDVLEAQLHVPMLPSIRTLTGNTCKC